MSMDKLIVEVKECVEREYGRAGAKFGLTNHSDHESYAVLLEEAEEANTEISSLHLQLQRFWELTKANDDDLSKYSRLLELERRAVLAACELIQVAAMAKKAALTICDRGATRELKIEEGDSL